MCIVDCYCGDKANPYREDLCQSGLFSFFDPRNSRKNELGFGEQNSLCINRVKICRVGGKHFRLFVNYSPQARGGNSKQIAPTVAMKVPKNTAETTKAPLKFAGKPNISNQPQ